MKAIFLRTIHTYTHIYIQRFYLEKSSSINAKRVRKKRDLLYSKNKTEQIDKVEFFYLCCWREDG